MNILSLCCHVVLSGVMLVPALALAQDWPAKTITLVVPNNAGTALDSMSRQIARFLSARLGQPVVVDNKPGGSGNIAANIVVGAAPDGYTLLIPSTSLSIAPYVTKNLPWDPIKDFVPIAMPGVAPLMLAGNMDVNAKTLPELLALARAQPGKINYGTSGKGTPHHISMVQLQQASGTELFHVPYKALGDMINGIVGGQVQMGYAAPGNLIGLAKAGKLRLYAVSSPTRLAQAPEVPTLRELGLEKAETIVWLGMFAPARTPPEVVRRLAREMGEIMKLQEYKDALDTIGFVVPSPGNAEHMAAQLREEKSRLPNLLQAAGITDSN